VRSIIFSLSFLIFNSSNAWAQPTNTTAAPISVKAPAVQEATTATPTVNSLPATAAPEPVVTEPTSSAPTTEAVAQETKPKVQRRLKRILALIEITIGGKPAGTMKAQLFPDKAPETVTNFVELAEGTKQFKEYDEKRGKIGSITVRPFYDGLTIHRLVPNYVVQGGCPFGTGRGGPGHFINDEFHPDLKHNAPGILSMANTGKKNSGGSQFFITLKELPHLNGRFAIFGKVIEGLDVLTKISQVKRDMMTEKPLEPVVFKSIKIVREFAN
jgi:peptidyl-prolyl cis-trans isomerase A (cyclophilin A)